MAVAVDVDPVLTSSYLKNYPGTNLLLQDISSLTGAGLLSAAGGVVDGIIGGPPCQGFSLMGKRDAADPRRELLGHYFRLVDEVQPKFFVMENVVGLLQGEARSVLDDALAAVSSKYQITGPVVLDAADFGAPTRRKRCFVIGIRNEATSSQFVEPMPTKLAVSVADAIRDLLTVENLKSDDEGFDWFKLGDPDDASEYARQLRAPSGTSTGNLRTKHSERVIERFRYVEQGKSDPVGRHQRLAWDGLCPTLRAGTGADKGSYQSVRPLHPVEPRVITVREAARLQGFPDEHLFHPTIWHSFRMIGNSVSPLMAEAVLSAVAEVFE